MMRTFRSTWDPLSLAFSCHELESHYTQYLVISTFLAVDKVFAYFGLFSNVCLAWVYLRRQLVIDFFMTSVVNAMCGLVVVIALRSGRRQFLKHRTVIMVILRSVRIFSGVYAYSLVSPESVTGWSQLRRIFLFGLLCTYWTCGMPVNLKIHAAHHAIALAIAFLYLQHADCGSHLDMWQTAFKALSLGQAGDLQPEEQCRRVLLFVLFLTGYALPTYILWAMELKSRIHYIAEMRIPLRGDVNNYLMLMVLVCACVIVWLLILFNF